MRDLLFRKVCQGGRYVPQDRAPLDGSKRGVDLVVAAQRRWEELDVDREKAAVEGLEGDDVRLSVLLEQEL